MPYPQSFLFAEWLNTVQYGSYNIFDNHLFPSLPVSYFCSIHFKVGQLEMLGAFSIWSHYRLMKLHHGSVLLFTSVLLISKMCFLFLSYFCELSWCFYKMIFSGTKDLFWSDDNFIWKIRFVLTAPSPHTMCITLYESKSYLWRILQKQTYLLIVNIFSWWWDTFPKIFNCPHQRSVL